MAFSFDSLLRVLADALKISSGGGASARSRSGSRSPRTTSASSRSRAPRPGDRAERSSSGAGVSPGRSIREVPVAEALAHAEYAPDPDGSADPGEIVWTWVPYQEDATRGKDRPVLVLGRADGGLYVVQLTSKDHDRDAEQEARWGRYWFDIGSGPWDPRGRPSEARLDRALWVRDSEIRREGASVPRPTWDSLVEALRPHA